MKQVALIVALTLLSNAHAVDAQPNANADAQMPGVSVYLLRFVDTGQPHVSVYPVTLMPVTNRTIFGPRTSFLGPTNITVTNPITGGPAAVFQYTNSSHYATLVSVQSMEYGTGSSWKAVKLPTEAVTMPLVPPNSTVAQTIPVADTNIAWRITVFCIEQARGLPRVVEQAEQLGKQAVTGQKTETFSGRKYIITSSPPATK
jgi:hypothetical protein